MKTDYAKRFIQTLSELHKSYPNQNIAFHLSFILQDYPSFDNLPDKELSFLADKYKCEKDLDFSPPHNESEIEKIIREGQDLDHILDEEDDDF